MGSLLQEAVHQLSQVFLYPTMVILLLLAFYSIFTIASVITEYFTTHRHFKVHMPTIINEINGASPDEVIDVIENSDLLLRQKRALVTVYENRHLPEDARFSLSKKMIGQERDYYKGVAGRNKLAAKVAPMFGLMGTLIPLGPGIIALGQGDTQTLSNSLGIAFDTTVAGLIVAVITFTVSYIRGRWYDKYMQALEAIMLTLLEKIDRLHEQGILKVSDENIYAQEVSGDDDDDTIQIPLLDDNSRELGEGEGSYGQA